jgi:hypothetical protein
MAHEDHLPNRDRRGVTNIKCVGHPRTMFFNGFAMSPLSGRPLPLSCGLR